LKCTNPISICSKGTFACGKCLNCRIHHRREWSIRCVHEIYSFNNIGCFITLTYDPEHLPENSTLVKSDLQNFFKRLRNYYPPRTFKYLACGEYGELRGRPHYHVLLFGLSIDQDYDTIKKCWNKCDWNALERTARRSARPHVGCINSKTANYVCGYIDKKYGGELGKEIYEDTGRIPPFRLVSLGLGRSYLERFYQSISANLFITFEGKTCSLPRYYCKKLKDIFGIDVSCRLRFSGEAAEYDRIKTCLDDAGFSYPAINYNFVDYRPFFPRSPEGYALHLFYTEPRFHSSRDYYRLKVIADREQRRLRSAEALKRRRYYKHSRF